MTINITLPFINYYLTVDNLPTNKDKIEDKPGIYYLYDRNRKLLYIGQAKNLYSRLLQHRSGFSNSRLFHEDIAYIEVSIIDDDYEREVYETHAIHELSPIYNRSKSFNRVLSESELAARELIKELQDERRSLVDDVRKLRKSFGNADYFAVSEIDPEDFTDWGTILYDEQRIKEIDNEISELKRVR